MVSINPKHATTAGGAHVGAPRPANEAQRLQALCALGILDTPAHERFDRLTRLASRLFDVPIALVSLVDADRQWFKSRVGLDAAETPREESFCAHAILEGEVLVVPDATQDVRFHANPLVVGMPDIRFYAGCPINAPDGHPVGTLCVIDQKPRDMKADDVRLLKDLAELVEQEVRSAALATIDDLTGLTNRRGFDAVAPYILSFCQRAERDATLLYLDLDNFKHINDTLGHEAGDLALKTFASALLTAFRDSDVVARLGGDEFCVLMSGASEEDAARPIAELERRLTNCVGAPPIEFSVGIAGFDPDRHETPADMLNDADRKMFEKKRGRAVAGLPELAR